MILFETGTPKRIEFLVTDSTNIDQSTLKIGARLEVNGLEYVFPGSLINDTIVVEIPPLEETIPNLPLDGEMEFKIAVEVISEDTYLKPYEDTFTIRAKARMNVEMTAAEDKKDPVSEKKIKVQRKKDTKPVTEKKAAKPRKQKKISLSQQFADM